MGVVSDVLPKQSLPLSFSLSLSLGPTQKLNQAALLSLSLAYYERER